MRIFVLNCGGSSIKFKVFDLPEETVVIQGSVSRLGKADAAVEISSQEKTYEQVLDIPDHRAGLQFALDILAKEFGDLGTINVIGHRLVHGGEDYYQPSFVDAGLKAALEKYAELAPLHNPPNLLGIRLCEEFFPGVPQVGVFDSAFNQTLAPSAYLYGIPYRYYEKYRVRKYGFHGITFHYMTSRAAELLGRPLEELKIVSLMLGSGCTANACKGGKSVEVSTGLTPTEGLIQSTRCGDIDPLAVTYLMRKEGLTPQQMDEILNRESGWLGISQVSNDMREVEAAARAGHRQAQLAIEAFTHRCRKYIGAYAAAMGGIDVLVFSGGLGEKSPTLRTQICAGLEFLGIMIDPERNREAAKDCLISPDHGPVSVLVIPTDEELVIARETYLLVNQS